MSKATRNPNTSAGASPIFKTQPNIGSPQQRSASINPKQTVTNQPMYKAHLGKPPSFARHPDAGPNETPYYRDPPAKLSEGVYQRLYEDDGRSRYYSPQRFSKAQVADAFDQSHLRRTNPMQQYQEIDLSRVRRPNYEDYQAEPKFPNTPFKQNIPRESDYVSKSYEASPTRNYPPQYQQYQQDSLPPVRQPNMYTQSPYPRDSSPQMTRQYEEYPRPSMQEANLLNEGYENYEEEDWKKKTGSFTPSYTNLSIKPPQARLPTLQESAKMRNPMFSSYDFAGYDKSLGSTSQKFKPQAYNYLSAEPVAPKEFLKTHVSTIAQAKRYDMDQQTKIHPQLGLLRVAPEERMSTPILKPYAIENENMRATFRSTKGMRQPIDSGRYEVNPLRSNVGFKINQQQPYQVQPTEVASARQKYSNSFFQEDRGQNRNMFAQNPYQGNYGGLDKQSTTTSMFSPSLKMGSIDRRYDRPNEQYAASDRNQMSYPW